MLTKVVPEPASQKSDESLQSDETPRASQKKRRVSFAYGESGQSGAPAKLTSRYRASSTLLWVVGPGIQTLLWVLVIVSAAAAATSEERGLTVWLAWGWLPVNFLALALQLFVLTLEAGPFVPRDTRIFFVCMAASSFSSPIVYAAVTGEWDFMFGLGVALTLAFVPGGLKKAVFPPADGADSFSKIRAAIIRFQRSKLSEFIVRMFVQGIQTFFVMIYLYVPVVTCAFTSHSSELEAVEIEDNNSTVSAETDQCTQSGMAVLGLGWFLVFWIFLMVRIGLFGMGMVTTEKLMEMRVGPFETFQLLLVAINAIPAIVFFSLSQNSANSGMPLSVSYALLGILFGSFVLLFFGNGLILSNVPKKAHASAECEFYRNFADGSCGSEGVWWPKEWPVEAGPWGATFLTLQGKPFFIAEMNARVLEDDEEGLDEESGEVVAEVSEQQLHSAAVRVVGKKLADYWLKILSIHIFSPNLLNRALAGKDEEAEEWLKVAAGADKVIVRRQTYSVLFNRISS